MESGEVKEIYLIRCFFVANMWTILLDEIIQLGVHGEVAPTGSCTISFLADLLRLLLHRSELLVGHRVAQIVASWHPGCEEMEREWGNGERMRKWRGNGERMRKWREIDFLHFLILYPFLPSFPISYIKIRHILLQNVKFGTFVPNVRKILTHAMRK